MSFKIKCTNWVTQDCLQSAIAGSAVLPPQPYAIVQSTNIPLNPPYGVGILFDMMNDNINATYTNFVIGSVDTDPPAANVLNPMFRIQDTNDSSAFSLIGVDNTPTPPPSPQSANVIVVRDAGLYDVSATIGDCGATAAGSPDQTYQFILGDANGTPYPGSGIHRANFQNTDDPHTMQVEGYLQLPAGGTVTLLISKFDGVSRFRAATITIRIRKLLS